MRNVTAFLRPMLLGAALAACMTPVAAQAQSTPAASFEIAGIRLGMTEAEARAAIRAFDPALRITAIMGVFNYRDGASMLTTPEYLDRLEAMKGNNEGIKVYFSGPVGDVRVIGVYRNALVMTNPPSAAQFAQSLIDKYGKPSGINGTNMSNIVWEEAGKPSCVKVRNGNQTGVSVTPVALMNSVEEFYERRRSQPIYRGVLPANLTQCGAVIDYNFHGGDPVRTFEAEMKDLGAIVAVERSRTAWVNQLQAEAVRKRQAQGQTPRL